MRLTIALLFIFLGTVRGENFDTHYVSLTVKNKSLLEVVRMLQNQSKGDYDFFYNESVFKNTKNVTISIKSYTLEKALQLCFQDQPITYTVLNKTILIKEREKIAMEAKKEIAPMVIDAIPIKGKITNQKGEPLVGASIAVKGSSRGTSTDAEGRFQLDAKEGDIIVVTYIGYTTREIKVTGNQSMSIIMSEANAVINEVVVTALGIKRSTKALTYNVQEIKSDEITRVPDASFVNSIEGKVAGVSINANASGVGGSTRVVMRGDKSINSNNNALFVLDGIPLPNLFSSSTTTNNRFSGQDGGDGISMLNPDDIKSLSVLTGPSAAALYGSMAANGVIIVNTKTGETDKTKISFAHSTNFSQPLVMYQFQKTYGTSVPGSYDSWGDKLAVPSSYNPEDFFQTGFSTANTISVASGNKNNQTYFSVGANNAEGIIPNNNYNRYNFTLQNTFLLNDKLKLDISGRYILLQNQNMTSQGDYYNPLIPIYLFPRGDDITKYQIYERWDPTRNLDVQFWPSSFGDLGRSAQNPWWIINRNLFKVNKNRYVLGANLSYDATSWLNLTGRVRSDNTNIITEIDNYASTIAPMADGPNGLGSYLYHPISTKQTYADLLATVNKTFKWLGVRIIAGGTYLDNRSNGNFGAALGANPLVLVPNAFTSQNTQPGVPLPDRYNIVQSQSVLATGTFSYKNRIFLDVTGRNEWPSQQAFTSYQSLFYPSAGLSAIISDLVHLPSTISYLKIRGSYAEVGNPPAPYLSNPSYSLSGTNLNLSADLPFNLVPERTKSVELGMNLSLLRNKIQLDATVYNSDSYNQVFSYTAPPSSGYKNYYVNGGKVNNKGIELRLGINLHINEIGWNSSFIFSKNQNKVLELANNVRNPFTGEMQNNQDTLIVQGGLGSEISEVIKGRPLGEVFVNSLLTDEHGYIYINPLTSNMVVVNNPLVYAGNTNANFRIGFQNSFNYRRFSLNTLIDLRVGGIVISATQAVLDGYGVSKESAEARDNGGVIINGFPYSANNYYTTVGNGTGVLAPYVYSATNMRMREASISYTVPSLFHNQIKDLSFSLIGRNLFMFYNTAPFDPEATASTGTYFQGIDYFMMPSLRSYGFSLKFHF